MKETFFNETFFHYLKFECVNPIHIVRDTLHPVWSTYKPIWKKDDVSQFIEIFELDLE